MSTKDGFWPDGRPAIVSPKLFYLQVWVRERVLCRVGRCHAESDRGVLVFGVAVVQQAMFCLFCAHSTVIWAAVGMEGGRKVAGWFHNFLKDLLRSNMKFWEFMLDSGSYQARVPWSLGNQKGWLLGRFQQDQASSLVIGQKSHWTGTILLTFCLPL